MDILQWQHIAMDKLEKAFKNKLMANVQKYILTANIDEIAFYPNPIPHLVLYSPEIGEIIEVRYYDSYIKIEMAFHDYIDTIAYSARENEYKSVGKLSNNFTNDILYYINQFKVIIRFYEMILY